MNAIYITAILTVTLTTNEVKLGTATIGPKTFDVVGLQVMTNRVVKMKSLDGKWKFSLAEMEIFVDGNSSWTNTYPGPFIATNLVPAPEASGWILSNTNFIQWGDIRLTNFITSTNIYYNAQ